MAEGKPTIPTPQKPIQACTWLVSRHSLPYVSVLWIVHEGEGERVCVLASCEMKWTAEEREGEAGREEGAGLWSSQHDSSRALTTCSRMSGQWSAICCRTEFAYSCSSALSRSHCSSSDSSWGNTEIKKKKCLLIIHFIFWAVKWPSMELKQKPKASRWSGRFSTDKKFLEDCTIFSFLQFNWNHTRFHLLKANFGEC